MQSDGDRLWNTTIGTTAAVCPTFDPAIVRPNAPGWSWSLVRLPHTIKTLPYNYCNENEYQRVSGYRREFLRPKSGRAARYC